MPFMTDAMEAMARNLPSVAGGTIIYARGDDVVELSATFGRSEFSVTSGDSERVEFTDRDFIFEAETLILGGTLATPERGDRVTVIDAARVANEVFEVLAPGGAQVYRRCDADGRMIRVHSKRLP